MSDNILGNNSEEEEVQSSGSPVTIIAAAFILLCLLSLIEWAALTGDSVKDYNLFADIMPAKEGVSVDPESEYNEYLDEALALLVEDTPEDPASGYAQLTQDDSLGLKTAADSLSKTIDVKRDTTSVGSKTPGAQYLTDVADRVSVIDGNVVIEDYTPDQTGMKRMKSALASSKTKPVKIAVMGDSYIEGDIITQDLRRMLQTTYGGRGVGYLAANNKVAGFRQTVTQKSKGWTEHPIKEASRSPYMTIAGDYYTGTNGATLSFRGAKSSTLKAWNTSRIVFVAPADGTITLKNDEGEQTFDITASDQVQSLELSGETSTFEVVNNVPGLIFLGAWLGDNNGIYVDNMSIRGDSGIPRAKANTTLASQMRQYTDYDLVILEFGINALSATQTDYTTYGKQLLSVIERVKACYPNADILVMGIGDRGQKVDGAPHSYSSAKYMVKAQRNAAKSAGVMFWDTREAMGGEDGIVRWRERKLANADYIHLNHKGGAELAQLLFNSLQRILK